MWPNSTKNIQPSVTFFQQPPWVIVDPKNGQQHIRKMKFRIYAWVALLSWRKTHFKFWISTKNQECKVHYRELNDKTYISLKYRLGMHPLAAKVLKLWFNVKNMHLQNSQLLNYCKTLFQEIIKHRWIYFWEISVVVHMRRWPKIIG